MDTILTHKLTLIAQRGGEGARYLIRRNLKEMTSELLAEACLFQNNAYQKEQALLQLANLLFLAEDSAQSQFSPIFRSLLSILHTAEDHSVKKQALVCAKLLGVLTPNELVVPQALQVA